jgi:ABC-2 type transport system permease protein
MTTASPATVPARVSPTHTAAGLVAVLRRGLQDQRRAALIWGTGLGLMSAFEVMLFPSIRKALGPAFKGYPASVKQAFGITDLGTIDAYLHAEMFSLVLPFALAYFAMRIVANAISGAEERGWLDSLLAAPVTRRVLVAGAFATAATASAAILLIVAAFTAAAGALTGDAVGASHLAAGLAGVWALALFFAGCATLAAGLLHRSALVLGTAGVVLGAMYLFDLAGKLSDTVDALRWLSAFRYYGTPLQTGLDAGGFALLVVAAVLLAVAGAWRFERRDVTG